MSGGDAPAGGNGADGGSNGHGPPRSGRSEGRRLAGEREPVRFRFLELAYGCHRRRLEFHAGDAPFVILGPNGAGKSTLVEAAVRALYGFNRQRKDERRVREERRPWSGGTYEATLGLEGPLGRVILHRDFETDEVVVRGDRAAVPLYEGEANPAASGRDARAYRDLLERLLGLAEREAYERTACVHQGGLPRTQLSEDLLQLAAGGHADVEEAREAIRVAHHALTVEPIAEGESRRRRSGEIESLGERARAMEARLAEAKAAEARRHPLVRERDAVAARLEELAAEARRLREAFRGLSELEKLDARREASRGRVRRLEEARRNLDEALARVDLLEDQVVLRVPAYPEDFLERAAALEEGLWPRRAGLREDLGRLEAAVGTPERRTAWLVAALGVGGAIAALAGVAGLVVGVGVAGGLALLVAALAVAAAVWLRRVGEAQKAGLQTALEAARRGLAEVEGRIRARLAGVPEAETLTPDTLPDRRREFSRLRQAAAIRKEARGALRSEMDRARAALEEVAAEGEDEGVGRPPAAGLPREETLVRRGRQLLARLDESLSEERNERLAPVQLELRRVSRSQFSLPDGVRPEAGAVEAALEAGRREEKEIRARLGELLEKLAYEGRPQESPVAVRARLEDTRARLARLEARAEAHRAAFSLVSEAYEAFRRTDQERLLESVSGHLARATGGDLGPVVAERGELEAARVESLGRRLTLASPPLSYGQLHSALFAVRLGASDFLAGFGIRLPLLVDDPFVHLDEARAGDLWGVLCLIARERQVVVATQDRLLLDHLGVEPDLRLGG